ncbi:hypothetical protein [Polaribacter sp. Hel_I_88]|uniref:hypothetical protein n=1 Tax=Polaribacter sp. Hel_I_88 TaxID=1250006 RepID=UPI00047C2FA9|nr:hypothetical protein [Polaribacter sp. Hel_I_88]
MHKKLEADLISLAHSILQMKNKDNVFLLKQKSKEIYEKLAVLAFVEEYVNATPGLKETKTELLETVEKAFAAKKEAKAEKLAREKVVYNLEEALKEVEKVEVEQEINVENDLVATHKPEPENKNQEKAKPEEVIEQPFDELEEIMFSKEIPPKSVEEEKLEEVPEIKVEETTEIIIPTTQEDIPLVSDVVNVEVRKTMSLEEELQDIVSVDFMADLFEKAPSKSLNDRFSGNIQIGLNDRIAFVKNLFNGNQEDYNRVISQLNTLKSADEAKKFINSMVKPDYNWSEKEELETRFMEIIERKFA